MNEVPEEEIEQAEADPTSELHDHDEVVAEDGSLAEHLRSAHGLEVERAVSPTTLQGLHDRVHGTTKAADQ